MSIRISSSQVLFSLAAAVLLWLTLDSPSSVTAACQFGTDKDGNCLCPPDAKPGQCKVQPIVPGGGCGDWSPNGSYRRSCVLAGMDCKKGTTGTTLSALCKTRQGSQNQTTLDITGCVGDIANMDGELHCSKGALPDGSYKDSCRDMWVEGGVLHAQCKTRGGQWTKSESFTFAPCRNGIENIDGHLRCR